MPCTTSKDKRQYVKVPEEEKAFLSDGNQSTETLVEHIPASYRLRMRVSFMLNALLCLVLVGIGIHQYRNHAVLNRDLRKCSSYSPIHDLIDLEPSIKKVNGTLFPPKDGSISRQMPNKDADELWEEWELTRVFPITKSEIVKMGKDPKYVVKLEDDIWGLGDDAYVGTFDVYHQLHCLNSLRHIAYGAYYNSSMVDTTKETMSAFHLNHCVDILMQALQCSGNVNIMTLDWVKTQTYPFPDMSVNRQCINFEKLTSWRKEHTIDMKKYVKVMAKPDGVLEKPMADIYYAMHGKESPNHPNGADPENDFNT